MRISDWSSDVCSSDLESFSAGVKRIDRVLKHWRKLFPCRGRTAIPYLPNFNFLCLLSNPAPFPDRQRPAVKCFLHEGVKIKWPEVSGVTQFMLIETSTLQSKTQTQRSEEHTSELKSLIRITYAVFCLKKK